jgi:hypothetical protein
MGRMNYSGMYTWEAATPHGSNGTLKPFRLLVIMHQTGGEGGGGEQL